MSEAAAAASIVLPSFDDEARIFGDADPAATARRYLALGAGEVVVKNAGGPITFGDGGGLRAVAARPDVAVVDATGAGDSFNGAYLAVRRQGGSMEDAVVAGRNMAATVIAAHGAIVVTPGMERWSAG